jgi:hypothetical protein
MKDRLTEMGGQCRVATKPRAGCRVEFEVPLAAESRNRVRLRFWPVRREKNNEPGEAFFSGDDAPQPTRGVAETQ